MDSENELLLLAAYVLMSSYRERAVNVLKDNVMTPKYIAYHCKVRTNHISKTLSELKEKGIVVCINEEAHKGRLYKLTELGEKVYNILPSLKGKNGGELNDL